MLLRGGSDLRFDVHQLLVGRRQVDFGFRLGRADIARNVEVVTVLSDLLGSVQNQLNSCNSWTSY
jgi:hypothetical protein